MLNHCSESLEHYKNISMRTGCEAQKKKSINPYCRDDMQMPNSESQENSGSRALSISNYTPYGIVQTFLPEPKPDDLAEEDNIFKTSKYPNSAFSPQLFRISINWR